MSDQAIKMPAGASFDAATPAVAIQHINVTDSDVISEARRWSTGQRGAAVSATEMTDADLTPFVRQALRVGAQAISLAGGAQDTFELEKLVAEVGTRTVESSTLAAEATAKAAMGAAETMGKAAEAVRKDIAETGVATRQGFAEAVATSTKALRDEVERLVGGDSPELLAKLGPLLDTAGRKIAADALEQTDKLLAKVSRQFDPADPTSPFAKQAKALAEQQKSLTDSIGQSHLALVGKVDELATALQVQKAATSAVSRTTSVTPLKGGGFEAEVDAVMEQIAAGLGDEYTSTGSFAGAIRLCRKGDGVLSVAGGQARVVVEMHDSGDRRVWNDYLDEAERNREAAASIGIVRNTAQNHGQTIRVLSSRRVVVAFDPSSDGVDLLRTVVQLMRTSAITASSRRDVEGLETAEESIRAALDLIERINTIRKASGSIRKGADTIDKECNTVQSGVEGHLNQALDALHGVAREAVELGADAPEEDQSARGAA